MMTCYYGVTRKILKVKMAQNCHLDQLEWQIYYILGNVNSMHDLETLACHWGAILIKL